MEDMPTPSEFWAEYGYPPDLQRLGKLLAVGEDLSRTKLAYRPEAADDIEVFAGVTALVRQGLQYGKGVHALLVAMLPDATGPLVRALDEVWTDVRYMLRCGSRLDNVRKARINAALEAKAYATARGIDTEQVTRMLAEERRLHPEIVGEVERQRHERRFHWSGLSRIALVQAVAGEPGKLIYRYLSWDTHSVMPAIRDVSISDDFSHIEFAYPTDSFDHIERTAYIAGGRIFYLWNEWAETFGLPMIEIVPGTSRIVTREEQQ